MTRYQIDLDDDDVDYLRARFPSTPEAVAAAQQLGHPCISARDRIIAQAFLSVTTSPTTGPVDLFAPDYQDDIDNGPATIVAYLAAALIGGLSYIAIWQLAIWAWARLT
ncbi:MAG: hypothetical protein GY929_27530 [Actinomycetia bacterium]|nr:hypothetical protein [Actinomycetes bacterium]